MMTLACGDGVIAVVREIGDVWACGKGELFVLGLSTDTQQLTLVCVGGREKFDGKAVVTVVNHLAAVNQHGRLFIRGAEKRMKNTVYESPGGLGHVDWQTRLAPTPVVADTRRPHAHSLLYTSQEIGLQHC